MLKNKGPKCGAMLVAAIAVTDVLLKSSCTLSSMFVSTSVCVYVCTSSLIGNL